ncbi:hypothetical protein [Rhodoferax ferrireducens]|uniref:hypothetical protein n=1 Tax=Rhodoferax ferrireducens TaxID=192843 RepID=UPI0013001CF6|nr:hypothetical protein [Rhodoferax ferrireducens]
MILPIPDYVFHAALAMTTTERIRRELFPPLQLIDPSQCSSLACPHVGFFYIVDPPTQFSTRNSLIFLKKHKAALFLLLTICYIIYLTTGE